MTTSNTPITVETIKELKSKIVSVRGKADLGKLYLNEELVALINELLNAAI